MTKLEALEMFKKLTEILLDYYNIEKGYKYDSSEVNLATDSGLEFSFRPVGELSISVDYPFYGDDVGKKVQVFIHVCYQSFAAFYLDPENITIEHYLQKMEEAIAAKHLRVINSYLEKYSEVEIYGRKLLEGDFNGD
jgi:predicted nucleic acid-binding protein